MKKYILSIITGFVVLQGSAQDLHFSQFFNSPLTTNPANTGLSTWNELPHPMVGNYDHAL